MGFGLNSLSLLKCEIRGKSGLNFDAFGTQIPPLYLLIFFRSRGAPAHCAIGNTRDAGVRRVAYLIALLDYVTLCSGAAAATLFVTGSASSLFTS